MFFYKLRLGGLLSDQAKQNENFEKIKHRKYSEKLSTQKNSERKGLAKHVIQT